MTMKLKELLAALDASTLDGDAYDEIEEKLTRYENAQESEYSAVLETCKEDMKEEFRDNPKTITQIDELTDQQMEDIAMGVESQLVEGHWSALKRAVEAELEEGK